MITGNCMEPPGTGGRVIAYEAHLAEVERAVAVAVNEVYQVQLLAEDAAAEAMRAACIAALEALPYDEPEDDPDARAHEVWARNRYVNTLREVQP